MGRAYEYRKARMFKRWGSMSKTFTRISKEIIICVKASGPDPSSNSRLRILMQNAKAANMPKDTVERSIKKAAGKDQADIKEHIYEMYGLTEEQYYIHSFVEMFGKQRFRIIDGYWQPKWDKDGNVISSYVDPSARTLDVYNKTT